MKKLLEFFQENNGSMSNTRLLITILVVNANVISWFLLIYGLEMYTKDKETLMGIVGAITTLLTTVGTVAGTIKIFSKREEQKSDSESSVKDDIITQ